MKKNIFLYINSHLDTLTPLQKRVVSGLGMSVLFVGILWGGPFAIQILFFILSGALVIEWVKICELPPKKTALIMTGAIYGSMYAAMTGRSYLGLGILLSAASIPILLSWIAWYRRFLWVSLGFLYIGFPCLAAVWMVDSLFGGVALVGWVMMIVAVNDVASYGFGTWLRGPKLMAKISPSKTWSGFFGGLACSTLSGGIFYFFIESSVSLKKFMGICLCMAFAAAIGDLLESKLKRIHKIKDSGDIIPGHGGLFDRLDGFLFVLPLVAIAIFLYPQIMLFNLK
jgi:phosphatidate cytidylyltransferase